MRERAREILRETIRGNGLWNAGLMQGCFPEPMEQPLLFEAQHDRKLRRAFARPLGRPSINHDFVASFLLSQRGWILQEMILSRRVLHLSKHDQLYWQCRSLYQSEDGTMDVFRKPSARQGGSSSMTNPNLEVGESHNRTGHLKLLDFSTGRGGDDLASLDQ